jgi:hypothetical protein
MTNLSIENSELFRYHEFGELQRMSVALANMTGAILTSGELKQRVLSNTGSDGRLQNEVLELDARTVAILSKRHQISVSAPNPSGPTAKADNSNFRA